MFQAFCKNRDFPVRETYREAVQDLKNACYEVVAIVHEDANGTMNDYNRQIGIRNMDV